MNKKLRNRLSCALLCVCSAITIQCTDADDASDCSTLWYEQEASEWMEALPLGNGRLGAMVFGGVNKERIALNEITLWSGQPDENQERPCGKEKLDKIRSLFFKGDYSAGNRMATEMLSGTPHSFGTHVPMGDLVIDFQNTVTPTNYYRELNLNTAISIVKYTANGVDYTRESFCSNPAGVMVMNLKSSANKALNFDLSLELLRDANVTISDGNRIEFNGTVSFPNNGPGGVDFYGCIVVKTAEGNITFSNKKVQVRDAKDVTLFTDIRTNYTGENYREVCLKALETAQKKDYAALKAEHQEDYAKLYDRVSLDLNGNCDTKTMPTDIRWQKMKDGGEEDVVLDALFFNYARYLLIAASREDSPLPANLQGLWNDNLACNMGWSCDYHLDINTQQNYWMANAANLAECNLPLFNFLKQLAKHGSKTAQQVYGARGWTAHTVANVWGYTSSGSGVNWGLHPTGGAWLATHLWKHYQYTQDKVFLENEGYPLLKKTAEFFVDYMVEDPRFGYMVTGPSTSPENSFIHNDEELALSMMPACDTEIVSEIFNACIESSQLLGVDEAFTDTLKSLLSGFPPLKISRDQSLCEWLEDFEQAQPNHRHTSHLLALYPFSQITPEKTPELAKAAEKSMQQRMAAPNWEDVEWSRANWICFNARLYNGDEAHQHLQMLYRNLTRENMLTVSPKGIAGAPYDIFIFDGNEAAGAGMCEMLLQSHNGVIRLLPALPQAWQTGNFKGLCAEGGNVVSAAWKMGKLTQAEIKSSCNYYCQLYIDEDDYQFYKNNIKVEIPLKNNIFGIDLQKEDILRIESK